MGAIVVAQAVAAHAFGVPLAAIVDATPAEDSKVIRGRQLAMYLARMGLKLGLRQVARAFHRSHPTVLHACRRIEQARKDPGFNNTVEWLQTMVQRAAGVAL